jgi:putative Ca2+/H+ antiporter (TMEM165/GDT1 family)
LLTPLFVSMGVVAIAEIGDKTQLLALLLAAKFRKPWPIIAGIFLATIANHAAAAFVGTLVSGLLEGKGFQIALGVGFVAMALWTLVPDKVDDDEQASTKYGAFLTTLVAFFLVEIGDKTQVATIGLAARYDSVIMVTCGTTLGMMLANVPAVLLGEVAAKKIPLHYVRWTAATIFIVLGIGTVLHAFSIL